MTALAIGGLGTTELLIILAVLVLLFGASKLPELARGSGCRCGSEKATAIDVGRF